MRNHYQPCFFMKNFSTTPNGRKKTYLYRFDKFKKEWLNDKIPIEGQNQQKNLYSEKLEKIYTEKIENPFRKGFLNKILLEINSRILSYEEQQYIEFYIGATICRHENEFQKFIEKADKIKYNLKSNKKDILGESILTASMCLTEYIKRKNFKFYLKCFNSSNKVLICPDVTVFGVKKIKKQSSYLIMPLSYNKVIIGSLPTDNIHYDELTIDLINNLSLQTNSKIFLADQKINFDDVNKKMLKTYSISDIIK